MLVAFYSLSFLLVLMLLIILILLLILLVLMTTRYSKIISSESIISVLQASITVQEHIK